MARFDVVICGLGAMGSAAAWQLARRGRRVLGLERFVPGHDRGSSHGRTRIIRLGYFEHPSYVPLVRRAYGLWRNLEGRCRRRLLHVTGIAEIGPGTGELVPGTRASMELHGVRHEVLSAAEAMRRFPVFALPPDYLAVLQPDGGFVEVEPAIMASLALAAAAGAQIRSNEAVRAIEPRGGFVRIVTERSVVEAEQAVVAAGPWTRSLLPHLPAPLRVTRQVAAWFDCADAHLFAAARFPVFMLQSRHGLHYGIPPHAGAGLKIAKHHHRDESVDPDEHDRTVGAEDEAVIRAAVAEHIPRANGRLAAAGTCLYTMAPDGDFVIDRLPGSPQVIVVSACSGHGFKFAPVIGEIVAELVTGGSTRHDISRFRLDRFR